MFECHGLALWFGLATDHEPRDENSLWTRASFGNHSRRCEVGSLFCLTAIIVELPCILHFGNLTHIGLFFTIRIHKLVLDDLGVKSIAMCIGGSMAGMHVYEWSFYGLEYVKALVPIAAPGKSSSWSMAWNEAQRQAIFADPKYLDGYYSLDDVNAQMRLYVPLTHEDFCHRKRVTDDN